MSEIVRYKSNHFFLENLTFSKGRLEAFICDGTSVSGSIIFEYVRNFAFFKESDYWQELAKYEFKKIIEIENHRTLGVFQILKNSILEDSIKGRFDAEMPIYYWLSTPDECLEIVCFDAPTIVMQH